MKLLKQSLLVLITFFCLFACSTDSEITGTSTTTTIVAAKVHRPNGEPATGVVISLLDTSTHIVNNTPEYSVIHTDTTDSTGNFSIEIPDTLNYYLEITSPHHSNETFISLEQNDNSTTNITLEETGSIHGVVETEQPSELWVHAHGSNSFAKVNANATFTLENVAPLSTAIEVISINQNSNVSKYQITDIEVVPNEKIELAPVTLSEAVFTYSPSLCINRDTVELTQGSKLGTTPIRVITNTGSSLDIYAIDVCLGTYFKITSIAYTDFYNVTFFSNDSTMFINTNDNLTEYVTMSNEGVLLDTLSAPYTEIFKQVEFDDNNYYFINPPGDVIHSSTEPLSTLNLSQQGTAIAIHLPDVSQLSVHDSILVGVNNTGQLIEIDLKTNFHTLGVFPVYYPSDIEVTDDWIWGTTDSHYISKVTRSNGTLNQVYTLNTNDSILSVLYLNN